MSALKPKDVKFLVVHCSGSPQGRGDTAATIHKWHLERGWDGIGYHVVILEDGTIEHGRPLYWCGAHVKAANNISLGVCLIGDNTFPQQQLKSLRILLDHWMCRFPNVTVCGHRDIDAHKTCPNFDVATWYYGEREG